MKKKLFIFFIIFIIPTFVSAENLKAGINTYSYKKINNYCEKVGLELIGYFKNDIVCLDLPLEKLYYIDALGKKVEFTKQEYLDYLNMENSYYMLGFVNGVGETKEIYKVTDNTTSGFVEVKYEDIDKNNKVYATIKKDTNGNYEYHYSHESDFVFDPNIKYYEPITLIRPTSAEIKSITYYETDDYTIFKEVQNPKSEDILSYFVLSEGIKEEKVAVLSDELFAKISNNKLGILTQSLGIEKLPNKDVFYIMYMEETSTEKNSWVYDIQGNILFENVDNLKVLNDDLIATIKDNQIKIYSNDKLELKTINGSNINIVYVDDYQTVFQIDDEYYIIKKLTTLSKDNQTYNNNDLDIEFSGDKEDVKTIKVNDLELNKDNYTFGVNNTTIKLKDSYLKSLASGTYTLSVEYNEGVLLKTTFIIPDKKNNVPILDLINPDTGDTIISSIILGGIAIIGLVVISKYKRSTN